MSLSPAANERITAIVSTLVAIAILAAGVTAHQSHSEMEDVELLQSGLQFQLDRAFQHDERERSERLAKLEATLEAWRESPRSQDDQKLLSAWLSESTIRSMPGTTKPLSNIPEFGKPATIASVEPVEIEAVQTAETSDAPEEVTTRIISADDGAFVSETAAQTKDNSKRHENPRTVLQQKVLPQKPFPQKNSVPVPDQPSSTNEKPIKINLTELAARIAGYHAGLDKIETALLLDSSPGMDFLEKQVQQLDELTQDFRFVKLYHEALSEKERQYVSPPRSMKATLAELERLLELNESSQDDDFLGAFDPEQRERLEKLREQLTAIAGRSE